MKGRQQIEKEEGDDDIEQDGKGKNNEEIIQSTPLKCAFVVHRRNHVDDSIWSATRLILPAIQEESKINYEKVENVNGGKEKSSSSPTPTASSTTTTTLEIVHSLVLGEENDRFFFNPDYTIAASTGLTKVWDGTWTILRCLLSSSSLSAENNNDGNKNDHRIAMKLLAEACQPSSPTSASSPSTNSNTIGDASKDDDINRPVIVEMGSGSGLVGLTAAYLGAHVLITDVPTVVENSLEPNIERNTTSTTTCGAEEEEGEPVSSSSSSSPWPEARSIGHGSIACASYDWRKLSPEENEVPYLYPPNVILAVECLWLKELLQPFVDASLRLLKLGGEGGKANNGGGGGGGGNNNNVANNTTPVMFMCSRERSKKDSQIFCSPKMAVQAFRDAGCTVTLIMEDPAQPLAENNNINEEQSSAETVEEEEGVGPVQLYCIRSS